MILELPEKLLAKLEELSKAERRTLEELIAENPYKRSPESSLLYWRETHSFMNLS